MMTEGKFGTQEAVWLLVITISVKIFFTSPTVIANLVGTSGWYMTLFSVATAFAGFGLIIRLLRRFPDRNLSEIYELALGRIAGSIFSLVLALYLLYLSAQSIGEFQEVLKVYVFPNTPSWYITMIFAVSVGCISWLGLESIARVAKLMAFFSVSGILAILALSFENYDIANMFPFFGYGLDKAVINGVLRCSAYGEIIILAVFARSLQGTEYVKKVGIISLLMSGLFIFLALLAFTLCFPYYTASEITSPMYELATLIDYGRFVQRIEPIFLFVWITASLLSVTATFYSFVSLYCSVFRIADKRPIVIASAVILFSTALMHRDSSGVIFLGVQLTRTVGLIPFFVMPAAALAIARIRKKGGNRVA